MQDNHLPLDTGASVYIIAEVEKAWPIIDILPIIELQDKQMAQILDRTNFFAAALFPRETKRKYQIAAYGKYPSSRASMALGANKHWEKKTVEKNKTYWYAERARLSVAVTDKQAFAASFLDKEPRDPRQEKPGVELPEGFSEFAHNVPISLWINNAIPVITKILEDNGIPMRIPVRHIFANFYVFKEKGSKEAEIEALIRLVFDNPTQARGAASVLGFAFVLAPPEFELASFFLANPPVQNGNYVDIKTARVSENDLKNTFSFLLN